jgi:hypothetical protein
VSLDGKIPGSHFLALPVGSDALHRDLFAPHLRSSGVDALRGTRVNAGPVGADLAGLGDGWSGGQDGKDCSSESSHVGASVPRPRGPSAHALAGPRLARMLKGRFEAQGVLMQTQHFGLEPRRKCADRSWPGAVHPLDGAG